MKNRHRRFVRIVEVHLGLLRSLVREALVDDDPRIVHDLRVCTRRLQQCLTAPFSEDRPPKLRRASRILSRIRHALGEWRNDDVLLELLDTRQSASNMNAKPGCKRIRRRRRRHIEHARRVLRRIDLDRVAKAVQMAADQAAKNLEASLRHGISEAWSKWKTAAAAAEKTRDVRSVHDLRIATKRLRYRIELTRDLGLETTRQPLAWLEKLQDMIGRWHDRALLREVSVDGRGFGEDADLKELFRLVRDRRSSSVERLAERD